MNPDCTVFGVAWIDAVVGHVVGERRARLRIVGQEGEEEERPLVLASLPANLRLGKFVIPGIYPKMREVVAVEPRKMRHAPQPEQQQQRVATVPRPQVCVAFVGMISRFAHTYFPTQAVRAETSRREERRGVVAAPMVRGTERLQERRAFEVGNACLGSVCGAFLPAQ